MSKLERDMNSYRAKLNLYTKELRKAKRDSWARHCESIENTSEAARLRKVLASNPTTPGYIKHPEGSWSNSSQETLELFMETHFPGCKNTDIPGSKQSNLLESTQQELNIEQIITEQKIIWAINSFKPYKSAGPDEIIPAFLQNALNVIVPWLRVIFTSCIKLRYVPMSWRKVKVVFIPKAGKPTHSTAKDYRPISLSSFLLKTLSRRTSMCTRK
ncbi:uncharacterized protein LOC129909468 [Episyrphus balteatus]|uniref:uncharacterized protein LOC129909468 n=1 Tax=Episyrphus balteatus TaxID=286459 RepID=UPI0024863766|nr:uncharacterized protein LOC129909468 [Episyrphus balteatus]